MRHRVQADGFLELPSLLFPHSGSGKWNHIFPSTDWIGRLFCGKPKENLPKQDKNTKIRSYFCKIAELFIDIKAKKLDNICMDFLSMGRLEQLCGKSKL